MLMKKFRHNFDNAKKVMIEVNLKGRDITDPDVLDVMRRVPRELFVSKEYYSHAYSDRPLPIGLGQTISQPYIVALMTQALKLEPSFEVLEIGTGCGYQAAVLSGLVKKVYTIERLADLAEPARARLKAMGMDNVEFFIGDGSKGWPEKKLFQRIVITASVPKIPQPMLDQLTTGGIIIAPVDNSSGQKLIVCEKTPTGLTETPICDVRFVKLFGLYAFEE